MSVNRNEHVRIVCKGLGLEVRPLHVYDLFINVAVLMYRMFNNDYLTSYTKVTGTTSNRK